MCFFSAKIVESFAMEGFQELGGFKAIHRQSCMTLHKGDPINPCVFMALWKQ